MDTDAKPTTVRAGEIVRRLRVFRDIFFPIIVVFVTTAVLLGRLVRAIFPMEMVSKPTTATAGLRALRRLVISATL